MNDTKTAVKRTDEICEKCICSKCKENMTSGERSASCCGCTTCNGAISKCPLDLFYTN